MDKGGGSAPCGGWKASASRQFGIAYVCFRPIAAMSGHSAFDPNRTLVNVLITGRIDTSWRQALVKRRQLQAYFPLSTRRRHVNKAGLRLPRAQDDARRCGRGSKEDGSI